MKVAVLLEANQPISIQEVPLPTLLPGHVRVRLHAAALNRRDYWISRGMYAGLKFPIIVGSDGCGTVEAVGDDTDAAWLGKRVIVNPSLGWGNEPQAPDLKTFNILGLPADGTLAETVTVPASQIYDAPAHLSDHEAAALPLAGLTAYRALFTRAHLKAGERLLVTGIGGGVATFLAQFGLAQGAEVWVTSGSAEKLAQVPISGIHGSANYREEGWEKALAQASGGFDVIADSAAGPDFVKLMELAKPGGRIVNFGATAGDPPSLPIRRMFWKQLSLLGTTMGSPADFEAMLTFVAKHEIWPVISSTVALDEVHEAFDQMASGDQLGKLVVAID